MRLALPVLGDLRVIVGFALGLEVADDLLDLAVGDQGTMDAADPVAGHQVEHVALAQELLGTGLAQNGAAVDLGADPEADARG